jgi:hypothetical protein
VYRGKVTVEATSPALIERVRTVTTDGAGQYRIIDLPGGTYSVTFTLAGFTPVRREGHGADVAVHLAPISSVDRAPSRVPRLTGTRVDEADRPQRGYARRACRSRSGSSDLAGWASRRHTTLVAHRSAGAPEAVL